MTTVFDTDSKGQPRRRARRKGWFIIQPGCAGAWVHGTTGWVVRQCGHPTALWPYYACQPGDKPGTWKEEPMLIARNGRGFQTLADAMAAAESRILNPSDETLSQWKD